MAISIATQYPGQTIGPSPAYPFGQGRNVTSQDDNTGTPYDQSWFNDIQGLLQALLSGASLTPSGTPDTATASQYLQALQALFVVGTIGQADGNIPQIGDPATVGRSAVVVNSGSNANGSFRVWSDDFAIQFGVASSSSNSATTITLPTPYQNALYIVVLGLNRFSSVGPERNEDYSSQTASSFIIRANTAAVLPMSWLTMGFI